MSTISAVRRVHILRRWRPTERSALICVWGTPQRQPEQETTYTRARLGWWVDIDLIHRTATTVGVAHLSINGQPVGSLEEV